MAVAERSTVNVEEAAQALGVNRLTLYSAIRKGESPVPVIKIGRRLVVPRAALDRVLEQGSGE
jgi:excisionase family DNA binding protein